MLIDFGCQNQKQKTETKLKRKFKTQKKWWCGGHGEMKCSNIFGTKLKMPCGTLKSMVEFCVTM